MLRHFQLFAPAPGREAEAEHSLRRWLEGVSDAAEFRGGAVLREYAGEFGEVVGALAVMYDVDSREAGAAFKRATSHIPNPMAQDVPGEEPADQGEVIFRSAHTHAAASHDHGHAHDDGHTNDPVELHFDRGGGLLARLMHGHFEILSTSAGSAAVGSAEG